VESPKISNVIQAWKPDLAYNQWFAEVFRQNVAVPGARLVVSWTEDSPRGLRACNALAAMECEYATELMAEIRDKRIAEDIVEFGIYKGCWITFLWQMTEQLGLRLRIYGFDSFEGLSEPHPEHDMAYWNKGQYACLFEVVSRNLQVGVRPRIKLVKGWCSMIGRMCAALENSEHSRNGCRQWRTWNSSSYSTGRSATFICESTTKNNQVAQFDATCPYAANSNGATS
jgi:hypothetical protein